MSIRREWDVVSRLELVPPEAAPLLIGATSGMVGVGNIAISSDGAPTRFAYSTNGGVAVRSLDQLDTRVIEAGRGLMSHLFFSPDGPMEGVEKRRPTGRVVPRRARALLPRLRRRF